MSNALQPKPRVMGQKVRVCIVASQYNQEYTDVLVQNALDEIAVILPSARIDLIRVPGAFEIPVTVSNVMSRNKFNCVIALGLIIQGETGHASLIASSITDSLQKLALEHNTPVVHEVLLVQNEEQAHARCIGSEKNRGREAARAAANIMEVFAEVAKTMPTEENKRKIW